MSENTHLRFHQQWARLRFSVVGHCSLPAPNAANPKPGSGSWRPKNGATPPPPTGSSSVCPPLNAGYHRAAGEAGPVKGSATQQRSDLGQHPSLSQALRGALNTSIPAATQLELPTARRQPRGAGAAKPELGRPRPMARSRKLTRSPIAPTQNTIASQIPAITMDAISYDHATVRDAR